MFKFLFTGMPPSFSAPKLLPITDEDCDRILQLINEPDKEEKKNSLVDGSQQDDRLNISSKNRYTPYNHQERSNPPVPKVTRKQLPISGASPYFVEQPKKPVISNSPSNGRRIFTVMYGKDKPYKKHKVFSNDGYLIVMPKVVELRDSNQK